jgi:hypothetical protein
MSACTWFENEDIKTKTKERVKSFFMDLLLNNKKININEVL